MADARYYLALAYASVSAGAATACLSWHATVRYPAYPAPLWPKPRYPTHSVRVDGGENSRVAGA